MPTSRRLSGRPSGRPGSSRRQAESSGRHAQSESSRRSQRPTRSPSSGNQKTIYIGVGVAVLLLTLVVAALSSQQRPPVKKKVARPVPVPTLSTTDWYSTGYERGRAWKAAMANKVVPPTADDVAEVADRMTADYSKKGIDGDGEQRFIRGFKQAVLGN